ncbi:cell division protein ZapA [Rhodobacteraceae bacterium HSP-20]|uniref:Cell division protein ZapA n=1 Tax=Paragemmobacter amnigenus TaxID=2852097 RepID=A0ABS6IXI3_9RHOB|nr:cell division protein ZapA [Rhodobacter amnigenus]MBU9696223.1 cell division protein ZapA [Rhodobacter amnigenus]MBV4387450.1 cell division protein ZapA [Rhodobacter amnigenus]
MPELTITIGGRAFSVACQEGEEHFLSTAAAMLDAEAQPLVAQMGRLPEGRMLLMAGLMLADKTAAAEDEIRTLRARIEELEARPETRVEVPVIPPQVTETLAEIAARAEALADRIDDSRRPA